MSEHNDYGWGNDTVKENSTCPPEPKKCLVESFLAQATETPPPDVTLILGTYQWQVHGETLSEFSDFFKMALQGTFQEAKTRVINLHEDNPWILARAIEFMYTSCYTFPYHKDQWGSTDRQPGMLKTLMETFQKTDQQDDRLRDMARTKYNIHCAIIVLADKYGMRTLLDHTLPQFVKGLGWITEAEAFWDIERQIGRSIISRNEKIEDAFAEALTKIYCQIDDDDLQKWCLEEPKFAVKLIHRLGKKPCGEQFCPCTVIESPY